MEDTTPTIMTPNSTNEIPGGYAEGVSPSEAAEGLFDALAEDSEFSDNDELEQSTTSEESEDTDGEFEEFEDEGPVEEEEEAEDGLDEDFDDELSDGDEGEEGEEALYEVTLPGGEKSEVTLDELQAGYSRTEDYTRKRQRDAAEHTDAMAEMRDIRSQYADRLEKLETTLADLGPQAPTAALRQSNPGEYAAQMAEYQAFQDTLKQVNTSRDAISDDESAELRQAKQAHVQQEWERAMAKVPEWTNNEKAIADLANLRTHAVDELGFSGPEIDSLADHRLLLMLKENFELKQARRKGKKVVEKKRKSSKRLKPGSSTKTPTARSKQSKRQQAAKDELAASTGSVKDAARAIEMLLDD